LSRILIGLRCRPCRLTERMRVEKMDWR
jgi:hypothetical protein